ncbi:MAG TPA: hypothetical protein PKA13_12730 [Geminicoccaceae bacterium]|nr:hypothetical protein [Geminicoccus sp.]HMU50632.1 hypothetical protein [Geminicoccaceae bacterium]
MGALTSLATTGLNLALSSQAQKSQDQQLKAQRDQQIQQIQLQSAEERRQGESALKRRLAEERARAGASGVGGSGGSADAVLRGLEEESQVVQAARDAEDAQRIAAIRDTFSERRKRNLLDFSSQWLNAGSRGLGGSSGRSRSLID